MTLLNKYRPLIAAVDELIPAGVEVMEQNSVLIFRGIAPNGEVKNKLWDLYSQIDPNFISGEVILDIQVAPAVKGCKAKLIVDSPTLTIRKGPGVELPNISSKRNVSFSRMPFSVCCKVQQAFAGSWPRNRI